MKWKQVPILILLVSLFSIATYFYFQNSFKKIVVIPNKNINISPTITPTPDPNHDISVLLLGYGGAGHDGGYLTDSIILARISPKLQKIDLISLPRDLWINIPISITATHSAKINSAYTVGIDDKKYPNKAIEFTGPAGGGQLSKYVISQVTGIKPDYFFFSASEIFAFNSSDNSGLSFMICLTASRPCPSFVSP